MGDLTFGKKPIETNKKKQIKTFNFEGALQV
jgi:hypothetical protein